MQGLAPLEKEAAPPWLSELLSKMESNTIREVNLSRKSIGDVYARAIVQVLQKNTSVVAIDLSWNALTAETAKSLSISLAKNATLKSLNLNSNSIDVDGARAIAEGLKQNKGLTSLKLSWNQLLDEGAKHLALALTPPSQTASQASSSSQTGESSFAHKRNTTFSISSPSPSPSSSTHHGHSGSTSSAHHYFYNASLVTLELACNAIGDDGAKAIFNAVKTNPALVEVNLEWNDISDDAVKHILPALIQADKIRSVMIFSNEPLASDTTKALASSMQGNTSLQTLTLSGKFGDSGAKYLASALTRHHLLHLHLNKCKIGDEGVKYLCTALMTNKSLSTLHLSSNKIGNDGAKALQLLLEVNVAITELDLSANRIGDSGVTCLATALTINVTLTALNLQQNEFTDGGRRSMESSLTSNWSLVDLKGMVSARLLTLTRKRNQSTVTSHIHTSLGLANWPADVFASKVPPVPALASPTAMPSFDRLVTLVLHNNLLATLPSSFAQLKSLKALVLSRNRLVSPLSPIIGSLTSLTNLDLRCNLLDSLPTEIGSLKALTKLNASYNRLLTLPPSLGACTNMREMFLFDNKLDVLPSQIARLNDLKIFDLRYNPLKFVLESVFPPKTHLLSTRTQIEKLFSYLTSLGEGEPTVLNRVKLMLVGDANVGKTSLRKYLAAGEKAQAAGTLNNVTTDGIEISDIQTGKKSSASATTSSSSNHPGNAGFASGSSSTSSSTGHSGSTSSSAASSLQTTFTTYDFAGQQLYYTTHQFFLSDKAIYLVVYNLTEVSIFSPASTVAKAMASIEYWLKSIRVRTKYSPVVLVGTHLDEVGRREALDIFTRLKTAFKNYRIDEYFAVSAVKAGSSASSGAGSVAGPVSGGSVSSPTSPYDPSASSSSASGNSHGDSSKHALATISSSSKEKSIDLIPFLTTLAERRRLVGQTVPHSCGQLINYIEEFRRTQWSPLMRFDDFKKVIIGYNTMDILGTVSLLTSMGYCLYFENDLNLRDVVILNPQSLANLMSAVITLKFNHVKDAKLSIEDFAHVYSLQVLASQQNINAASNASNSTALAGANTDTALLKAFRSSSASLSPTALRNHLNKLLFLLEKFEVVFQLPSHVQNSSAANKSSSAMQISVRNSVTAINSSTHVLVPCMLAAQPPPAFIETQTMIRSFFSPGRLLFARTYKFQFMPYGFFSRLFVRLLNLGPTIACWGLWRDGLCLRELDQAEDVLSATAPNLKKLKGDFGYVWYDPMEYKLQIQVLSTKDGVGASSAPSHAAAPKMLYPFLDRLIRAIDALIDVFYAKEKEGMLLDNKSPVDVTISCVHCLREQHRAKPTQFRLAELIGAYMNDEDVYCSGDTSASTSSTSSSSYNVSLTDDEDSSSSSGSEKYFVDVAEMIPDLILSHLPTIEGSELKENGELLGEGGFATVWKGIWHGLPVAIKELKLSDSEMLLVQDSAPTQPSTASSMSTSESCESALSPSSATSASNAMDDSALARFKLFHHEVFMMSAFDHPNLVHLYGIATSPLRIVMEYVPGSTLTDLIHNPVRYPSLSWRLVLKIALDISRAMSCLHAAQPPVVHRDLRPQNVFVASADELDEVNVKVGDFGLAQRVFATDLKQFLGSFFWLAPEVLIGDSAYSLKSDIYSFAMIFWELITRQAPFSEFEEYVTTREETLSSAELADTKKLATYREKGYQIVGNKIVLQEFRKQDVIEAIVARNLRPTIPKSVDPKIQALIASCWSPVINSRPDFATITEQLEKQLALLGKPNTPPPPTPPISPRESAAANAALATGTTNANGKTKSPANSAWQVGSKPSSGLRNQTFNTQTNSTTSPQTSPRFLVPEQNRTLAVPGSTTSLRRSIDASNSATETGNRDSGSTGMSYDEDEDSLMNGWVSGTIETMREELEDELDYGLLEASSPQMHNPLRITGLAQSSSFSSLGTSSSQTTPTASPRPQDPSDIGHVPQHQIPKTNSPTKSPIRPLPKRSQTTLPASLPTSTVPSPSRSPVLEIPTPPVRPRHGSKDDSDLPTPTTANTVPGFVGAASRPKRPPPQPLMSQQRVGTRSVAAADAPTTGMKMDTNGSPVTYKSPTVSSPPVSRPAAASTATSATNNFKSDQAPSGNAKESPTTTAAPAKGKRPTLVRSLTTTPSTSGHASSPSPKKTGVTFSVPSSPQNPQYKTTSATPISASLRALPPTPGTTTPSANSSPPIVRRKQSEAIPVKSNTTPHTAPASATFVPSSAVAISSFSKALATSPPLTGTSPNLKGTPPTSVGRRFIASAVSPSSASLLPLIGLVWSKPTDSHSEAKYFAKVAATNELWIGTKDSSLDLCDNAVSYTGTLTTPELNASDSKRLGISPQLGHGIVAMAATEEHVWTGLEDGRVVVWDPLLQTLQSTPVNSFADPTTGYNTSADPTGSIFAPNSVSGPIVDPTPVTAIHAAPRPNDVMTVWTAHASGIIRQWMSSLEMVASLTLPPGFLVTHITHMQAGLGSSLASSSGSIGSPGSFSTLSRLQQKNALRSSNPERASSSLGPSIWFAVSPGPQKSNSKEKCKIYVTDCHLRLITSFDVHPKSTCVHSMVTVGNKVWTSADDGISVWNAITCELEQSFVPSFAAQQTSLASPPSSSSSNAVRSDNKGPQNAETTIVNCLCVVANPKKVDHHLVWAFTSLPQVSLLVYDSISLSCVSTMVLPQTPTPIPEISLAKSITKDRVLSLSKGGLISLWSFQKNDTGSKRMSSHLSTSPSGIVSPGSARIQSPRRPVRQAPSSPSLHNNIEFK